MLQMHVVQPVPPAMEPPVVKQMAAQAGLGQASEPLSTKWKAIFVGGSFLLMSLAYWNCVQRGACQGFWRRS